MVQQYRLSISNTLIINSPIAMWICVLLDHMMVLKAKIATMAIQLYCGLSSTMYG